MYVIKINNHLQMQVNNKYLLINSKYIYIIKINKHLQLAVNNNYLLINEEYLGEISLNYKVKLRYLPRKIPVKIMIGENASVY